MDLKPMLYFDENDIIIELLILAKFFKECETLDTKQEYLQTEFDILRVIQILELIL
jgi:hypothetical protein